MAHNKGQVDGRTMDPRAGEDAEELRRKARHEDELEPRRDVTDAEAGIDGIQEKSDRRDAPPLQDNG
jgi:hypothetical protein